ncbi:Caffeoylshikimate esterase [Nymphaea thermarum]|nr:Caffeoylshikimate esterase [Nymphaea thermarum]
MEVCGIDYEGHGKSSGLQGYIDDVVDDCSDFFTSITGYAMECSITMKEKWRRIDVESIDIGTGTRLAEAGMAVYGIDYEGHGKSAGLRGYVSNFDEIVGDCRDFFTSVAERKENKNKMRFLFGESMGGAVALFLHQRQPSYWDGAILVAPMCKISEEMKPNPLVHSCLNKLCKIGPTWKLIPTLDLVNVGIKDPKKREEFRANPYCYKGIPRLKTGNELLKISLKLEKSLHEVSLPFLVVHGEEDRITDPSVSKLLFDSASSTDKTLKLYPGMWHALTSGEPPENIKLVFSDITGWLEKHVDLGNSGLEREHQGEEESLEFIISRRGLKLFACRWLPRNQEPKSLVFLCHGYAVGCETSMNGIGTRLAEAGMAAYGMDYEGHGRSSGLRGYIPNFDEVVGDCWDFYTSIIERKENKNKMRFLLGESMGGAVALLLHKKQPSYWDGAVLVAPMCKIADEMKPSPLVISILSKLCRIIPTWKIIPTKDLMDVAIKVPSKREEFLSDPYCYKGNTRLKTGYELLRVSTEIEKSLHEVILPFLVVHGEEDRVTDPKVSKLLYESASSKDKTFKLYSGMWHALISGETPENIELVFTDIVNWLDKQISQGNSRMESEIKAEQDDQIPAS